MELYTKKHIGFALRCLRLLPAHYTAEDASRMSLAFFSLSVLELFGVLQEKLSTKELETYRDWIYEQQLPSGGFRGSPATGPLTDSPFQHAHLINTYTALLCLALLRDDFVRLNKANLKSFVRSCQKPSGCFAPYSSSGEEDVRSSFSAIAICNMLGDFSCIDLDAACLFIIKCQTYDGGFAQAPGCESQGGSTCCAISALSLCDRLGSLKSKDETLVWSVHRQVSPNPRVFEDEEEENDLALAMRAASMAGFQGRAGKDPDACYSYWIGATIRLLDPTLEPDKKKEHAFLLACQDARLGGFAKEPNNYPDIYHTYLALCALAMGDIQPLKQVDIALNTSLDTLTHLRSPLTTQLPNGHV